MPYHVVTRSAGRSKPLHGPPSQDAVRPLGELDDGVGEEEEGAASPPTSVDSPRGRKKSRKARRLGDAEELDEEFTLEQTSDESSLRRRCKKKAAKLPVRGAERALAKTRSALFPEERPQRSEELKEQKSELNQKKFLKRLRVDSEPQDAPEQTPDSDEDGEHEIDYIDFSSKLCLKGDHEKRALWVCPDRRIYMETFSPLYKQAYDFLIAVAHPLARTRMMHQYVLNHGSLYAAVSVGLDTGTILRQLDHLSKVDIPEVVVEFIKVCTDRFGKVRSLLIKNRHFVHSQDRELLQRLREDETIDTVALSQVEESAEQKTEQEFDFSGEDLNIQLDQFALEAAADDREQTLTTYSFEVDSSQYETVKRRFIELDYPLLEEYDFSKDTVNETIQISLKTTTTLRPYQKKCLAKMFACGRVKSGIISLACGAGKSLVGVATCCVIKKKTLLLCTSTMSVQQWKYQFLLWSNINHHQVVDFVSGGKTRIACEEDLGSILLTTYSMLSHSTKRSDYSSFVVKLIEKQEWGLVILDEVHVVPANTFRSVISKVKSHCKLGLSATLIREDDMIDHLLYLIGPKLYEANWLDLCKAGHIANVCCAEVPCPMTPEFFKKYLLAEPRQGRVLYTMNPNKLRTCEYLIRIHEAENDKILVFSDNILVLKTYAAALGKPCIYGGTTNSDRMRLLSAFQYNLNAKTLFISKIGDNSIDLPEATVIIQISSHYGSRRQEAQRLGRILRPKSRKVSGRAFDAFFYSLVSQDTKEMYYSAKRQQFLIEQGYIFKMFKPMCHKSSITVASTKEAQLALLRKVLAADVKSLREIDDEYAEQETTLLMSQMPENVEHAIDIIPQIEYSYTRMETGTNTLSGATGIEYDEIQEPL
ncbi:general transcription and DNA repair factor IIH helicase subunit XPB-like [Schistocerca gregaria]|uniref:general transcription and DNA repair factor IIH helicase subunit XPB-like n=1 Tax=Schistocerca gregaria TaxID=7010 RepID=UPI00211EC92E|nr:general transcription and DNA repair factor IIH helicase subunit XPB-like [Schistocerca gregaria]